MGSSAAAPLSWSPQNTDTSRIDDLDNDDQTMSEVNAPGNGSALYSDSFSMRMQNESITSSSLDVEHNLYPLQGLNETGVSTTFPEPAVLQVPLPMSMHRDADCGNLPVTVDAAHGRDVYTLPDTGGMDDFWQVPFMGRIIDL